VRHDRPAPRLPALRDEIVLDLRREASLVHVDAVAAHRHAFAHQELSLPGAFREAPVGSDDPLPGEAVRPGEDEADETRRTRVDVAVGAHPALWDCADSLDDAVRTRLRLHGTAIARGRPPSLLATGTFTGTSEGTGEIG